MAQYYGKIKLAPHIVSWVDRVNNIYLTDTGRTFKCVTDDMDLEPIGKGLDAGLIVAYSDEGDGSKLPRFCFGCSGHIATPGVLAPYYEKYDVIPGAQSLPRIIITGDAQVPQRLSVALKVFVESLPEDEDGNLLPVQIVPACAHDCVTFVPEVLEINELNFNDGVEVVVTAGEDMCMEELEFIADGYAVGRFQLEIIENPVTINFMRNGAEVTSNYIQIARGAQDLGEYYVALSDGSDIEVTFTIQNSDGSDPITFVGDAKNIPLEFYDDNLIMPTDWKQAVVATVKAECVYGSVEKTIIVPEMKMMYQIASMDNIGAADAIADSEIPYIIGCLNKPVGPTEGLWNLQAEATPGDMGYTYLIKPKAANDLNLVVKDILSMDMPIEQGALASGEALLIHNVEYDIQYADATGGWNGMQAIVVRA